MFLSGVHTSSDTHRSSYSMCNGGFSPANKAAEELKLDAYIRVLRRLRLHGAVPLLSPCLNCICFTSTSCVRSPVSSVWRLGQGCREFTYLVPTLATADTNKKCCCLFTLFQYCVLSRSQWPRGLRRRSAAKRLLGSWVRIPPEAWMFVCCECLCCQVEVSATDRSLVQRRPTDCGVCLSVIKWK
jgi:hypothetical protein